MTLIEILVIIFIVVFLSSVIGVFIYKKVHNKPMGECACCQRRMKKAIKRTMKNL